VTLNPVRFSRLKLIARSPLHYAAATVEETMAMEVGSAVHSLVLGGKLVVQYVGEPDEATGEIKKVVRRGKAWEAFRAEHAGDLILTAGEYQAARAIADAVLANPLAAAALDGQREVERAWQFGRRACGGRIDCVTADGVTELKVSNTADPARFVWHALRMGWLSQLAWYLDGLAAGGTMLEHARIVAVEPKPPYAVTVFKLSAATLDQARRTYRSWFERLLVCEATDEWPPYAQSEVELDVPDNDVSLDFGEDAAA
jgi:hypothetical protein